MTVVSVLEENIDEERNSGILIGVLGTEHFPTPSPPPFRPKKKEITDRRAKRQRKRKQRGGFLGIDNDKALTAENEMGKEMTRLVHP